MTRPPVRRVRTGSTRIIYTTNPSVPNHSGTQDSLAWAGILNETYQEPYVLVQEGSQKLAGQSQPTTWYQINVGGVVD
jgi:type II secretory pathway component PulC